MDKVIRTIIVGFIFATHFIALVMSFYLQVIYSSLFRIEVELSNYSLIGNNDPFLFFVFAGYLSIVVLFSSVYLFVAFFPTKSTKK